MSGKTNQNQRIPIIRKEDGYSGFATWRITSFFAKSTWTISATTSISTD